MNAFDLRYACKCLCQLSILLSSTCSMAANIQGLVLGGGAPIENASVVLYKAGSFEPLKLAQTQSNKNGKFNLAVPLDEKSGSSYYLVAQGGHSQLDNISGDNPAITLVAALGPRIPSRATINEYSTIATVWTHNQFISGQKIQGPSLALGIAAGNTLNFVDLATGGYGSTIQDPLNSSQTPTMANFSTLANLLSGCIARVSANACSQLFLATTSPSGDAPTNTLSAAENIARYPSYQPGKLFALLDTFYPVPSGKKMRVVPYMPYLTFAPSAWVLPLKFAGGGVSGGGKLMIDSKGNVWVGNNFIVGAQNQSILWNGNLSKFAPDGKALSPITTGFMGGGLSGVGFGLAIDEQDTAWVSGYASQNITRFDSSGKALSPSTGWTINDRLGEMQGIIVTKSGDIWAVDQSKNQLVYFPKGDAAKAKIYCETKSKNPLDNPCGLFAPFHLAIDQQERIWVSNNIGSSVIRFKASDPSKMEKFEAGYGGSGVAIDSQGNLWHAERFGSSENGRLKMLELMADYASKGEKAATESLVRHLSAQKAGFREGGSVTVLRPDGSMAAFSPISGKGLACPWALAVDGNDNVWVSNLVSDSTGIVQLCGVRPENCLPGQKTGDAISPLGGYVGGGMQQLVDIGVGPAGDVWVTNNWDIDSAAFGQASEALSTRGAGQGVVVFYGMAKPVKTPQIGPPRIP